MSRVPSTFFAVQDQFLGIELGSHEKVFFLTRAEVLLGRSGRRHNDRETFFFLTYPSEMDFHLPF